MKVGPIAVIPTAAEELVGSQSSAARGKRPFAQMPTGPEADSLISRQPRAAFDVTAARCAIESALYLRRKDRHCGDGDASNGPTPAPLELNGLAHHQLFSIAYRLCPRRFQTEVCQPWDGAV